jgi:hypothetical protein
VLVVAGVALLLAGAPTAAGVAPLAVGLLVAATPIGLVLRALAPREQEPSADTAAPVPDSPPGDAAEEP